MFVFFLILAGAQLDFVPGRVESTVSISGSRKGAEGLAMATTFGRLSCTGHRLARWLAGVIVAAGVCTAPSALKAEEPDLAEIIDGLNRWRESFLNLRVVWELRSVDAPPGDKAPPDAALPIDISTPPREDVPPFVRGEWIWADHGLSLLEKRYLTGNRTGIRTLDVWNGPQNVAFRAFFLVEAGKGEVLKSLDTGGLGATRPISSLDRTPLTGV